MTNTLHHDMVVRAAASIWYNRFMYEIAITNISYPQHDEHISSSVRALCTRIEGVANAQEGPQGRTPVRLMAVLLCLLERLQVASAASGAVLIYYVVGRGRGKIEVDG